LAVERKTAEEREEARIGLLTLIAGLIGFASGFIAYILYHLIGLLTNLFFYQKFDLSFASSQYNQLGVYVVVVPAIGGLIAGLMIKYGSSKIIGHGIPEAMESVLLGKSKIEPRVGILKALSAAFTIGSGQPFGAEGPIIQTGGAFGSFIGQLISVTGVSDPCAGEGLISQIFIPSCEQFLLILATRRLGMHLRRSLFAQLLFLFGFMRVTGSRGFIRCFVAICAIHLPLDVSNW
jgi:hypothetical protein